MTLAIVLVLAAVISLAFILRMAVSRGLESSSQQIVPLDVAAFRNLIDPAEDEYLRSQLAPNEFRHVRRERMQALSAYVQAARRNAAFLIQIGQSALSSSETQTAEAGKRLVNDALLLRRNATVVLFRIYVQQAWPDSGRFAMPVLDRYERMSGSAMLLGRLQNPASPVRASAHW